MKYYLSAILGFSIWGTFAFVLKPLSGFSAFEILFYRVVIATACIIAACFIFRNKQTLASIQYIKTTPKKERTKLVINLVASAVVLSLNWFLFIYVINAVSVNATSLAYLVCPILTTCLASIFLHEKLTKTQWLAVLLSLSSCVILAYGHIMDLVYSMVIAVSYAAYLILQKKNTFQIDKLFGLAIHIGLSCILLLPLLTVIDISTPKTTAFYSYITIISVIYTIVPLFLNIYALKRLDSSIVGTLLNINPIISFLLAVLYYNEVITTTQIIAFAMIFLAVVIFNIAYLNAQKQKSSLLTANS